MTAKHPSLAIIVTSHNDLPFLRVCIQSLYRHTSDTDFRLIIIDDVSTDDTRQWIDCTSVNFPMTVLHLPFRHYFTRANNAGLERAFSSPDIQWSLLLNSDTELTPGWRSGVFDPALALGAGIVSTKLLHSSSRLQHAGAYGMGQHYGMNRHDGEFSLARYVPWATGAFLAISRPVYDRCGPLPVDDNPSQYDASDREYCTKAWLEGFPVVCSAHPVYHYTLQAEAMRKSTGPPVPEHLV